MGFILGIFDGFQISKMFSFDDLMKAAAHSCDNDRKENVAKNETVIKSTIKRDKDYQSTNHESVSDGKYPGSWKKNHKNGDKEAEIAQILQTRRNSSKISSRLGINKSKTSTKSTLVPQQILTKRSTHLHEPHTVFNLAVENEDFTASNSEISI